MARVYSGAEFRRYEHELHKEIRDGAIFIHPTDTIYGIGCDARNTEVVHKLVKIKERPKEALFPIIAPSKNWIRQHCVLNKEAEQWCDKLPGPYMFVLPLKKDSEFYNNGYYTDTIGVRIPNHWISEFTNFYNLPLITTSANKSGECFMRSLEELDEDLKNVCSFIIYEDRIEGRPSTIVKLTEEGPIIKER